LLSIAGMILFDKRIRISGGLLAVSSLRRLSPVPSAFFDAAVPPKRPPQSCDLFLVLTQFFPFHEAPPNTFAKIVETSDACITLSQQPPPPVSGSI